MRKLLTAILVVIALPMALLAQNAQGVLTAASVTCAGNSGSLLLAVSQNNSGAVIQIAGTFSGTMQFEASSNGGNFVAIAGTPIGGGAVATSTTAAGAWQFGTSGVISLCARVSAFTSGVIQTTMRATVGSPPTNVAAFVPSGIQNVAIDQTTPGTTNGVTVNNGTGGSAVPVQDGGNSLTVDGTVTVAGAAADGAAVSGNPVRIAGKDGSGNTQDICTDTSGNLCLPPITYNSTQPTYTNGQTATQYEVTTRGELKGTINDAAGNARGANVDSSNRLSVTVDNIAAGLNIATIGTSIVPGTGATNLGKAEDAAIASGDTGVVALYQAQATPTATAADNDYITAKTNANGVLWSQGIQVGAVGATAPTNANNDGAKAVNAEQTAVTNGQLVSLVADLVGKLIVLPYANPENFVSGVTAAITDTTSTQVIASAGGSLRNYVTHCTISNSHATVGTFVKILDGTTIIDEVYAAAVGGGAALTYPVPLKGTAATQIMAQPVTTGANVIVGCSGYKGL